MKSIVVFSLLLAVSFVYSDGGPEREDAQPLALKTIKKRMLGGYPAKYEQFPYQARLILIRKVNARLKYFRCGGVLISRKIVLTAGHCVKGALGGHVLLGTTNLKNREASRVIFKLNKNSFLEHENHNPKTFKNDIALVMLPRTVKLTRGIKPIRLPRLSQGSLQNHIGIISGFGKTGDKQHQSMHLLYAKRRILSANFCQYWFPYKFLPTLQICVDGDKKSACYGDSGGPLVIKEPDGLQTVVGVTSYGWKSCEKGVPTVFTRISSYLPWINQHTGIPIRR